MGVISPPKHGVRRSTHKVSRKGVQTRAVFRRLLFTKKMQSVVRQHLVAGEVLNVGSGKTGKQTDLEIQAISNFPKMSAPITGADE